MYVLSFGSYICLTDCKEEGERY